MKKVSRADITILLIFTAIGLLIPAAVAARHFWGMDPIAVLKINWGRTFFGTIFLVLATIVCLWNFYLSVLVPRIYVKKHGSMEGFAHTSGLPVLGTIFCFVAGVLLPSNVPLGVFILFLYFIDGNGIPLILVSLIREGF